MEEKIATLTEILNKLKGEVVWITYDKGNVKDDITVEGEYVVISKIREPGRVEVWQAYNSKFLGMSLEINKIITITQSHTDIYRNDEGSVIYYNENENTHKHTR